MKKYIGLWLFILFVSCKTSKRTNASYLISDDLTYEDVQPFIKISSSLEEHGNRKMVSRNSKEVASTLHGETGKYVFNVCINPKGTITYVAIDKEKTTITRRSSLRKALKVMWKYKYDADPSAPEIECGEFTFNIDHYQR